MSESSPDQVRRAKISALIQNADLYDLIKMSLRAADVKNQALELYIQQALLRSQKFRKDQSDRLSSRLDAISETDTQYAK